MKKNVLYGWELLSKAEEKLIAKGVQDCKVYGGPFHLVLFPTDRCNLNCFFCYTDNLRRIADELEWPVLERALLEGVQMGVKGVSFGGGGESLLYRSLDRLLALLADKGLLVDSIKTNGTALTLPVARDLIKLGLQRATISLNDPEPTAYAEISRTAIKLHAQAMTGIDNILQAKAEQSSKCEISLQVFVWKTNFRRLPAMITALAPKEADVIYLNTIEQLPLELRLSETERSELKELLRGVMREWAPKIRFNFIAEGLQQFAADEQYMYYQAAIDSPEVCRTPQRIEYCYVGWYAPVIAASGDVYPCCHFASDKKRSWGNLHQQTLREIWQGQRAQQSRQEMRHLLLTHADKELLPRRHCFISPLCLERTDCAFNFFLASPDFYWQLHRWAESGVRKKYLRQQRLKKNLLKVPRLGKRMAKKMLRVK